MEKKRANVPGAKINDDLVIGDPVEARGAELTGSARLTFDGYKLKWVATQPKSWTGFSGPAAENERESVKDTGPTPQGHYTVDPADIQELDPDDDWGSYRVRLQPLKATVDRMISCFKLVRTGLYIHGGSATGTHGCIELNDDAEEKDFFATLAAYGRPIDLDVKYSGQRETKYEDPRCPY